MTAGIQGPSRALPLLALALALALLAAAPARAQTGDHLVPVRGTVRGPDGKGLAAAEVSLWFGADEVGRAQADAWGAFTLLAPRRARTSGPARVVATAPGHVPGAFALEHSGQDLELRLRPGEAGALRGRVMGADGLALAGARVRLIRGERGEEQALTDRLGWFAFPHLEAGIVTLEVLASSASLPLLRADARVIPDEAAEVQLRVAAPAALTVLVREREAAVPGCRVQLIDPSVTRFGGFTHSLAEPSRETDVEGLARFEGLPPGRYYLRASSGGRAAPLLRAVELRAGAAQRVILEAVGERTLKVRVVDGRGAPVPNLFMDVSMPGINWQRMPSARTGGDGVATFFDLPAGRAEVHVGRMGQDEQDELWRMVQADGDEATLVWTGRRSVRLRGRIAGYQGPLLVVCALPDVVHMTRAEVGPAGQLDLTATPPEGDLRVFLLGWDRRLAPIDLGRVDGIADGFEVRFARGAQLRGRLVDGETGRGIPGRVRLAGVRGGVHEAQRQWLGGTDHDAWITVNEWAEGTGPDGLFQLDGLGEGTAHLELEGVGAVTRSEVVGVGGSQVDAGSLRLAPH